MKRRDVLKAGAVAPAAAAVGTTGCATVPRGGGGLDEAGAQAFLASLDRMLGLTDQAKPLTAFVDAVQPGPRTPEVEQKLAHGDGLMRRMLRAAFVTQTFRDQAPDTQLHPAVQGRMYSHLDEIDATMFELSDFLAAQSPDQRRQLRDVLRKQPDVPMRIAEAIDRRGAALGLTAERRRQLRSITMQTSFRLRTDAPGDLIDEYTAKVDRLRGADGNSALAIALAEKLGQRSFWKYQKYLMQAPPGPQGTPAPPPAPAPQPTPQPTPPPPPQPPPPRTDTRDVPPPRPAYVPPRPSQSQSRPGRGAIRAGAYMLGIGTLTFGISAALVSSSEGFLIGITVGAILFVVGLITLIIGALIAAAS